MDPSSLMTLTPLDVAITLGLSMVTTLLAGPFWRGCLLGLEVVGGRVGAPVRDERAGEARTPGAAPP